MKNLFYKTAILLFLLLILTKGNGQTVNGGSAQGLINQIPNATSGDFKSIKPETAFGFWNVSVSAIKISSGLQELQVSIEFDVSKPYNVHGYNINGGGQIYKIADFPVNIRGRIKYRIEGNYKNPINNHQISFQKEVYSDAFGKSVITGSLFTWGPEIVEAMAKLKIMSRSNPTISFLGEFDVKITSIEAINADIIGLESLDNEIGKKLEKGKKEIEFQNLLNEARNAESSGKIDDAIKKYEEVYNINQDRDLKAKIDELKKIKENQVKEKNIENNQNNSSSNSGITLSSESSNSNSSNSSSKKTPTKDNSSSHKESEKPKNDNGDSKYNLSEYQKKVIEMEVRSAEGKVKEQSENPQTYSSESWQKFQNNQILSAQWNKQFQENVNKNEKQRLAQQKIYNEAAEKAAYAIVKFMEQLEAEKKRKEINVYRQKIKESVNESYNVVHRDLRFWQEFSQNLIEFGNRYKLNMTNEGLNSINRFLIGSRDMSNYWMDKKTYELKEKERLGWKAVEIKNDIYAFRLSDWDQYSSEYKNVSPSFSMLNELNNLLIQNRNIQNINILSEYTNDLIILINKAALRGLNYEVILMAEESYLRGGKKNYEFENLLMSAKAIKDYTLSRSKFNNEISNLKEKLKNEYAHITTKENLAVKLENITPVFQIPTEKKSEIDKKYTNLYSQIGLFNNLYKGLRPENINLEFYGYYVPPGTIKLTFSKKYSSPKHLDVELKVKAGQEIVLNLMDYSDRFTISNHFKPYEIKYDLKRDKFRTQRYLEPEISIYSSYATEVSISSIKVMQFRNAKKFHKGFPVLYINGDFFKFAYGIGKSKTGFVSNNVVSKYIINSSYSYFNLKGLPIDFGYAIPLQNGRAELKIGIGFTFLNLYNFNVNIIEESNIGLQATEIKKETGKYAMSELTMPVHVPISYNLHIGSKILGISYVFQHNFGFELDHPKWKQGDKTSFNNEYFNYYAPFLNINSINKYFSQSIKLSYLY